jgi:hypothetical protein
LSLNLLLLKNGLKVCANKKVKRVEGRGERTMERERWEDEGKGEVRGRGKGRGERTRERER